MNLTTENIAAQELAIIIEIEESLNKLNNMIKEWESTKSGVAESRRSFRYRLHGKDI